MSNFLVKIKKGVGNPLLVCTFIIRRCHAIIPEGLYLRMLYRCYMKKTLNLDNPHTYNEKLQWLKLYNRKDEYTLMVDKYAVKDYVASIIGSEYIIPTLGVYDSFDQIDFSSLPNRFVLKCTHDSGGLVICKDKKLLNMQEAREMLQKCLKNNYYNWSKEWPYKNVKPRIIAEEYMEDESGYELKDYKFFCFDGEPKALFIAADRGVKDKETKFNFYDMNFNFLPFANGHPNSQVPIEKPKSFEEMKLLATRLSQGIPHVRIDLYDIYGKVYFGEITFFHWSGFVPFEPEEWDYKFGSWINLPEK